MADDAAETERPRYGQITDEALATLRARLGVERPITEPYNSEATRDAIRHFARGIGETNPLWLNAEYARGSRWGGIVAPPCFLYSVHWGSWDMRRGHGLPGVHGLHAGDRWEFFRPVKLGEQLFASRQLYSLEEKFGSLAGRSFLQTIRITFRDQDDKLLARCYLSSMRIERDRARKGGKEKGVQVGKYSREEMAAIEADYDAEVIRGATPRYWEDVAVGDALQPIVWGPLTSADCISWVMGSGSPHIRSGQYWLEYRRRTPAIAVINPETGVPEPTERVHWDNYMAREAGLAAAYDYGSNRGALTSRLLTNWMGDDGVLKSLDARYRGVNYLGDTLWLRGTVSEKHEDGRNRLVTCDLAGTNQRGETIVSGRATVALPSRDRGPVVLPLEPDS